MIKLLRDNAGNAMIELALILPVLILMLLGVLDMGIILAQAVVVADSAREGAVSSALYYRAAYTSDVTQSAYVTSGAFSGFPNYSASAVVTCSCGPGGSPISCTGTCPSSVMPVQYMTVTATAQLPLLFGVAGLPGTIPVKSVARIRTAYTAGQ